MIGAPSLGEMVVAAVIFVGLPMVAVTLLVVWAFGA